MPPRLPSSKLSGFVEPSLPSEALIVVDQDETLRGVVERGSVSGYASRVTTRSPMKEAAGVRFGQKRRDGSRPLMTSEPRRLQSGRDSNGAPPNFMTSARGRSRGV